MDTKTKWHSCRLTVQHDSGRVRWCVGQEQTWQTNLKRLVFLPAILLSITLLCLIITHFSVRDANNKQAATISLKNPEDRENTDERDIFDGTKTSYLPSDKYITVHTNATFRQIREIAISALPFESKVNLSELDFPELNDTDLIDYLDSTENEGITWRVPIKKINKYPEDLAIDLDKDLPPNYDVLHMHDEDSFRLWNNSLSPEEIRLYQAQNMLNFMDTNSKPCDDFYQYACGNWTTHHPIPADHGGYDTFEMLRENLDLTLRELLEAKDGEPFIIKEQLIKELEINKRKREIFEMFKLPENASTPKPYFEKVLSNSSETETLDPIVKSRYLYKSCMNEDLIRNRGITPLINLLSELRNWPILEDSWDESNFDLIWLLAQLRLYNNDLLISEWIGPDIKNSNEYIIQIDQTSLGLPSREYFLDESTNKYIDAYHQYLLEVAIILGAPVQQAIQDALNIINFEKKLAKITANPEDRRNVSNIYCRLTLGELQALVSHIDWIRYFQMVTERDLPLSTTVVCYCMSYLQELGILLYHTSPRTITNYLLWRFVRHRVNNLDDTFHVAKQRFYYILFGREKAPPRWQFCVAQVNANLGMALGNLFVVNHFDEKNKNDTMLILTDLQDSFRNILLNSEWLDDKTKSTAINKINAMRLRIGYPDLILDREMLTVRYIDIKIHPNYYFENCLSILRHLTQSEHLNIGRTVNKNLWNTAPATVNAYYSRNKNQIMFPAGILQPPFYHHHFPRALNYGGIGVVIGHEITHGFDDKGRLFDEEGNLNSYWSEQATGKFHEKAKCLIDQYNSFIIPEVNLPLDGMTTQGENIADNGGMKQAYNAYVNWLRFNEDMQLPGLNMTNKQLFFLNFAQVWCGSSRPEATRSRIKTAVHSPGRFRVLGTLRNSYDFAEVYKCPKGSPMNPVNKCRIW